MKNELHKFLNKLLEDTVPTVESQYESRVSAKFAAMCEIQDEVVRWMRNRTGNMTFDYRGGTRKITERE